MDVRSAIDAAPESTPEGLVTSRVGQTAEALAWPISLLEHLHNCPDIGTIVQMEFQRPLRVVTPSVDGDVLAALAAADASFTAPAVHRLLGRHSEAGVRRSLRRLVHQGIVTSEPAGRADLYRLNRAHLAAAPVMELARLAETYVERLQELISAWAIPPELVMMFGSAARGEMGPDSDIDLLVVGADDATDDDLWRDQIDRLTQSSTAWTGNDTRVLEFRRSELRPTDSVIDSIRQDGVYVAGDRDVLATVRRASR